MRPVYLLDTNIVSRLDPRRRERAPELTAWIRQNGSHLFLSVVTLFEIETGVLKLRRDGQGRRAEAYVAMREAIEADFGDRVLPADAATMRAAARLVDEIRPASIEWRDLLIAATARVHGLTVLTNNLRHFEPTGVPARDPLAALPPDAGP